MKPGDYCQQFPRLDMAGTSTSRPPQITWETKCHQPFLPIIHRQDVIHGPYGLVSMLRHWHNKALNLLDNAQPFRQQLPSNRTRIRSPANPKCPFFRFRLLSSRTQVHSLPDSILSSFCCSTKRWRGSLTNSLAG